MGCLGRGVAGTPATCVRQHKSRQFDSTRALVMDLKKAVTKSPRACVSTQLSFAHPTTQVARNHEGYAGFPIQSVIPVTRVFARNKSTLIQVLCVVEKRAEDTRQTSKCIHNNAPRTTL